MSDRFMIFIASSIMGVFYVGMTATQFYGPLGLLVLGVLPIIIISLRSKRFMDWLIPYERIIPNGSEFKTTIQEGCDYE